MFTKRVKHVPNSTAKQTSHYTVAATWHLWFVMGDDPAKGTHDIIGSALAAPVSAVIDNEKTEITGS